MIPHLPARFDDARDVAPQGQIPEADATHLELSQEGPRTSALLASVAMTDPPLRRLTVHVDCLCHDD
jgi:hypothetical protein